MLLIRYKRTQGRSGSGKLFIYLVYPVKEFLFLNDFVAFCVPIGFLDTPVFDQLWKMGPGKMKVEYPDKGQNSDDPIPGSNLGLL